MAAPGRMPAPQVSIALQDKSVVFMLRLALYRRFKDPYPSTISRLIMVHDPNGTSLNIFPKQYRLRRERF